MLKVVMNWMVKKLKWFLIQLVINPSLANRFKSHVIPSTPRTVQPTLATVPTSLPPTSPSSSHARPPFTQAVRPSPIQEPMSSPIITSQQLQPMASSSRRIDVFSPLPFPAAQVMQRRDC
ncbi:hypothetical protein O181_093939 [Austropuccinia psidii MF-1]|uniref:Uncharacterized protein n=1 Tax=Austropuccinia psidii MF-1 TaxID=1389203 RepID=A0A9Q3PAB6_9BASI|nr:hypothetical protein [Austropuccinia psidii MF-1]